ncbi:MAG: hypothetical protein JO296_19090 [Pseudonocardiales bacterium]|nr:hypothetical protein [Pseudonocardiales bacterium]
MVQIGAAEADPFPAAQRREPGGSIRWAVGTPDGPRSQSWSLFGSTNHDDVYLGPRWQTGAIKLSLHRSGRWRMAWTEKYAKSVGMPDNVNRVLTRWNPPQESRAGWRHAVTLLVTPESVVQQPPQDRQLGKVAFFPVPNPDGGLWFHILLGQPGSELTVTGAVEVGTLRLPSGGMVAMIVRPGPLSPGSAAKIAEIRAHMLAAVTAAGARRNTAFIWGRMADDAVLLLDPGPVEPESAAPVRTHQNRAPGRLTYVRRADHAS